MIEKPPGSGNCQAVVKFISLLVDQANNEERRMLYRYGGCNNRNMQEGCQEVCLPEYLLIQTIYLPVFHPMEIGRAHV